MQPAQAEELAGLIRRAFIDVAQRFDLTVENAPRHPSNCQGGWITEAMDKGVRFWGLYEDGDLCGCVGLEQAGDGVCYLERLAVLPELRRRGLGRALVDHVLGAARGLGSRRVEIGLIADQEELIAWYGGFGFQNNGRRRFDHLPFEVAFMALDL